MAQSISVLGSINKRGFVTKTIKGWGVGLEPLSLALVFCGLGRGLNRCGLSNDALHGALHLF